MELSNVVYPCLIVLERLDPAVIPPIPNMEIPLGKYYHALQQRVQNEAVSAEASGVDDEILRNYPSFTSSAFKRYPCNECDKIYFSKRGLERHKLRHAQVFFSCTDCGRQFSDKSSVERHQTMHTNVFPYPCDECPLGFVRKGLLSKHKEKWHSPDSLPLMLYQCPFCPMVFNKSTSIKSHMSVMHREQYNDEELQVESQVFIKN